MQTVQLLILLYRQILDSHDRLMTCFLYKFAFKRFSQFYCNKASAWVLVFGHFYQLGKGHCPISCFYLFVFLNVSQTSCNKVVSFYWSNLVDFSSLCVFKWILKLPAREEAKSHLLHLFGFSPLCIFTWVLKWLACEDAKSHRLHLFDFSPLCVFKCFLKSLV